MFFFMYTGTSVWRFLGVMTRPFRWHLSFQVFVCFLWAADISIRPYLIKVILNDLANLSVDEAIKAIQTPVMLLIGTLATLVVAYRVYDVSMLRIIPQLRRKIIEHFSQYFLKQSQGFYQQNLSGDLVNRITQASIGVPLILKILLEHFIGIFLALVIAVYTVFFVNLKYAVGLFIWVVLAITGSCVLGYFARKPSLRAAKARSSLIGQVADILTNMVSVRLFARSAQEKQRLGPYLDQMVGTEQRRDWCFFFINLLQGILFLAFQAMCVIWLIQDFQKGYVTPGDFALILTINASIVESLWHLSKEFTDFVDHWGHIKQGILILNAPCSVQDRPHAQPLHVSQGVITFRNVHFSYTHDCKIFEDLSISIQPHQKVGLVGYSGSGKTTFVSLILRLFDIQRGHILIDEQDITHVTQDSLRRSISMIPQEATLFHRTLIDNIRYGADRASEQEVMTAARHADADMFIEHLSQRYATLVGERGASLSGGQRQRISVTRAFLKNAPILILDEATSQLDSVTETKIQTSLRELMEGKTTIVVAHRMATLLQMDRILVFDDGKIVEDGSHQELLNKGKVYRALWETQVGGILPNQHT